MIQAEITESAPCSMRAGRLEKSGLTATNRAFRVRLLERSR